MTLGVATGAILPANGDGKPDILDKPYNWETPRVGVWLNLGVQKGR